MTRRVRKQVTGGLLLAVYIASTLAASLLHDHAHPAGSGGHDSHSSAELCHRQHAAGCHADDNPLDGTAAVDGDHHTLGATDEHAALVSVHRVSLVDDACVVCRFLGLSSLPVVVPSLPASHDLVAEANTAEPRHSKRPLELTLHSRAPPQVG